MNSNRHSCSLRVTRVKCLQDNIFSSRLLSLPCRQAVPGGVYQRCQKRPLHRPATPVRPQLGLPVLNPPAPPRPFPPHPLCCYWNSHSNQCMMVLVSHIIFLFFSIIVVVCEDGGGILRRLRKVISVILHSFFVFGGKRRDMLTFNDQSTAASTNAPE